MPSLNWADIVGIAHDEAKQALVELLDSVGYTATSWQEGEPGLAQVELSAEIWSQLSQVAVYLKGAFLNKTATGEALTRLADSFFDNTRGKSVAAQRRTSLACAATSGPHSINLGALVLAHPDGPTYRNVADGVTVYPVILASGGSLSGLVFEAEVAGSEANKAAGTVTIMQTTLAGVTVTSDTIERYGADDESDPTLKTRNTSKWALLTEFEVIDEAVKNIALTAAGAAGGGGVTDVVVDSSNPRGAGTFDVYMASELATASAGDITLAQTAIDARVFGSTATPKTALVFGAPASPLNLTGTVYYQGSYLEADMALATQTALEDFIKLIPLGGYDFYPGPSNVVPINDVEAVIRGVQIGGQDVRKTVVLTSPVDLIVAAFGKVTPGTMTLNFVRVTG